LRGGASRRKTAGLVRVELLEDEAASLIAPRRTALARAARSARQYPIFTGMVAVVPDVMAPRA